MQPLLIMDPDAFRKSIVDDVVRAMGTRPAMQSSVPPSQGKVYKLDEAADELGISRYTLYGIHSRGEIKGFKKGKRVYFTDGNLYEYMTQKASK